MFRFGLDGQRGRSVGTEVLPCDENNPSSSVTSSSVPSDYDVVDPYETDRREAMRQLYPDEFATYTTSKSMPNFRKIPRNDEHVFRVHGTQIFSGGKPIELNQTGIVPHIRKSLESFPQGKKSGDFSEWGGHVDITDSKFLGGNNNIAAAGSQKQLGGEELMEVVEKNGFGITGFKVRKFIPSEKRHVHSGEVTVKPKSSLHDNEFSPKTSIETLNALDWMLQNITDISERDDELSMRPSGSLDSGVIKENPLIDQPISTTEAAEIVVPVMSIISTTEPAEIVVPMMSTNGPKIGKSRMLKKFPKFRRRITEVSQARSFGFRTLIDDKEKFDRNEPPNAFDSQQSPIADSTTENDVKSAQLLEEIIALEAYQSFTCSAFYLKTMMMSLEKEVEEAHNGTLHDEGTKPAVIDSSSQRDQESPLDMSSVSSESGFLSMASKSHKGFHQQPIHFIIETATTIEISRWSDWSEWGDCFCDKQVRTRRCIYSSSMSHGCEGESYESRNCTGGWCITSSPPVRGESTKLNRSPVRSLS
ncbi:unnamed protein product [Angiostrongylus costaricensis]|uniref:TLDc domain-containing protein n=1 Tax=Angiostrongylus costaricensis TaxID=334426 RepID=A0A158PJB2_ANGCS|nr:unnamed protein product [Angiostrongylus costaricensis]